MLCRIQVEKESGGVVVRLAGHLTGAHVPDLLEACGGAPKPPRVELDELMSADVVGIDALRRIEDDGAQLVGLLQYLRFELDTLRRKPL